MPGWGEILQELQASISPTAPGGDLDGIRGRYIARLHELSGRAVIVYSSGWLAGRLSNDIQVVGDDVLSMMECCRDVNDEELDLIRSSPGGQAQAAEQIVEYLRTQFGYIRCFVPMRAKSPGTMIALGCDEIVAGNLRLDVMRGASTDRDTVAAHLRAEGRPRGDVVRSDRHSQAHVSGGGVGRAERRDVGASLCRDP